MRLPDGSSEGWVSDAEGKTIFPVSIEKVATEHRPSR